jgi:peptidyl-dipeptidase A
MRTLTLILSLAAATMLAACGTPTEADVKQQARELLDAYQAEYDRLRRDWTATEWEAAVTGSEDAFAAHAAAEVALNRFHSSAEELAEVERLVGLAEQLDPLDVRALEVARLAYREQQLPPETLERMASMSAAIQQTFNTFRGTFEGREMANNDLLELLAEETDSARRQAAWEALKQVGAAVADDLVALAEVRNQAARSMGFDDFWHMKIRLQDHDPGELLALFDELEQLTLEPFAEMKAALDQELADRFGIAVDALIPWHYDNPFFQAAPPSSAIDLDEFYRDRTREEIAVIAQGFYADIGLPVDDIIARSDLYEREGKDQHAFCEDMDRAGDVRILVNLRPTAEWMDTMLHELGHAVYDKHLDPELPFNLRQANHIFTTEAVAQLFGALAKNPTWIAAYSGGDPARAEAAADAIREQRRREQLIFCRWTLVMLHFEKALYEDPRQDLDTLWWDLKERFQLLRRPAGRVAPDWAAKPHFTIAPVYYHNYMLGELLAAQLRATLARIADHDGPTTTLNFVDRQDFGEHLKETVFAPGRRQAWPEFVRQATGEPLTARHFAAEL